VNRTKGMAKAPKRFGVRSTPRKPRRVFVSSRSIG
jgi:hypothetical protein